MASYTLNNWDGRETTSGQQQTSTQVSVTGSNTSSDCRSQARPGSNGQPAEKGDQGGQEDFANYATSTNTREIIPDYDEISVTASTPRLSIMDALKAPLPATRKFMPIFDSPLHSANADNASKRSSSPLIARILQAVTLDNLRSHPTPLQSQSLPQNNENDVPDAISLYTDDAEGEDENDDVIVVQDSFEFSPSKQSVSNVSQVASSSHSEVPSQLEHSLFTPPPSDENLQLDDNDCPPADKLFTPPPSSQRSPTTHRKNHQITSFPTPLTVHSTPTAARRFFISHVEIPLLKRPRNHYVPMVQRRLPVTHKPTKPPKPKKKPQAYQVVTQAQTAVKVHKSLGEALQASINHNEDIGTFRGGKKVSVKKKADKGKAYPSLEEALQASIRHNDGQTVVAEKKVRKMKEKEREKGKNHSGNAVAGPSSLHIGPSSRNDLSNINKRHRKDSDSDYEVETVDFTASITRLKKKPKPSQVDIDLTVSDNEVETIAEEYNAFKQKARHTPFRTTHADKANLQPSFKRHLQTKDDRVSNPNTKTKLRRNITPTPGLPLPSASKATRTTLPATSYNTQHEILDIIVGAIRPVQQHVLAFNTRFVRSQSDRSEFSGLSDSFSSSQDMAPVGEYDKEEIAMKALVQKHGGIAVSRKDKGKTKEAYVKAKTTPWFCRPLSRLPSSSFGSAEDEISLGGHVPTSASILKSKSNSRPIPASAEMMEATDTQDTLSKDSLFSAESEVEEEEEEEENSKGQEGNNHDSDDSEDNIPLNELARRKVGVWHRSSHSPPPQRPPTSATATPNKHQVAPSTPALPPPTPPKIDLAALFQKKGRGRVRVTSTPGSVASLSSPVVTTSTTPYTGAGGGQGRGIPFASPVGSSIARITSSHSISGPNGRSQSRSQQYDDDLTRDEMEEEEPQIPIVPSAKALGKRRAVSPSLAPAAPALALTSADQIPYSFFVPLTRPQLRLQRHDTTNAQILSHEGYSSFFDDNVDADSSIGPYHHALAGVDMNVHADLDVFINDYAASPDSGSSMDLGTSTSRSHSPKLQLSTSLYANNNTLLASYANPINSQDVHPSLASSSNSSMLPTAVTQLTKMGSRIEQERVLSETMLDSLDAQQVADDPWVSLHVEEIHGQYEYSTIDPTLLDGGLLDNQFSEPESWLNTEGGLEEQMEDGGVMQTQPYGISPSSKPSSTPSPSSEEEYTPSVVSEPQFIPAKRRRQSSASKQDAQFVLPRRQRVRRQMADRIPSEELDAMIRSTSSENSRSSSSEFKSEDEEGVVLVNRPSSIRKSAPAPVRKGVPLNSGRPGGLQVARKGNWPKGETLAYCHQCRGKTNLLKMPCRCGKLFCVRCITTRYPGEEFDTKMREFSCPVCQNYCNCTACCSKRGELYVGLRRDDRMSSGATTSLPPTVPMPESAKYWGTIYSLTGEKLGTSFTQPDVNGLPSVVFAQTAPLDEQTPANTTRMKRQRVFIGAIQSCWNIGRHRKIRDLAQLPRGQRPTNDKARRVYVGDSGFLKYRIKRDNNIDLLEDLSSLSSLEDDSPEQHEPPKVEVFTPGSLEDVDISRAITLGLNACGVPVAVE